MLSADGCEGERGQKHRISQLGPTRLWKRKQKLCWDVPRHAPSFALRLEESQDVVDLAGPLDVADDAAALVVHHLDADLDDTTARAGAAEHLGDLKRAR